MKPYNKHYSRNALILLIGSALPLAGCRPQETAEDSAESKAPVPVPVRCATASVTTPRPSLEVVCTLVSIPEKTAVLSTQVAGQVQQLLVVEGQRVQAGDVLLQLDDRSAEAQRAKARAAVEESRAIVSRLKHGSRSEDIDVARQELRKSETNLRLTHGKVQSGTALQDVHAIPELEIAERTAAAEAAEADVAANQAKLKLLEAGPRPEEIAEAEAKLAGAEADLAASELNLQLTRVTAPFDGVLMDVPVRQGMFVSAGTTLMTLADLSTLFARTRVPTAYLSQVKEGQNVDVRVASFPDDAFTGTIARIRTQADVQTGDVDAFASAPNPDGSLRPGLACRLQIWLPEIRDAVAVPVAAIADRDGSPVVTVIRDERAYETEVRLGALTNKLVQVLGGVSPGDLVAVEGGYGLPDGCPCKVQLETSPIASSAGTQETP